MFEIKVRSFFSAAHFLRNYKGKCENLHGHNWKVEVTVEKPQLNKEGLAIDFKEVKRHLEKVLVLLDHKNINRLNFFKKNNPSSENLAYFLFTRLEPPLKKKRCRLKKVTVWEQRDYSASYFKD